MKALKEATKDALKKYGQDVLFEVKFDWLKNNWNQEVVGYDSWSQCFEMVILASSTVTSSTLLTATDSSASYTVNEHADSYLYVMGGKGGGQIRKIKSNSSDTFVLDTPWQTQPPPESPYRVIDLFGINNTTDANSLCRIGAEYPDAHYVDFYTTNKGAGALTGVGIHFSGEQDIWTLICVDETTGQFIIYGSVNKVQEDAYVDTLYNNGYISFTITQEANKPFKQGDIITVYPALLVSGDTGYLTNGYGVSTGLLINGGPDFLSWLKIEWLGENISIQVRSTSEVPGKTYSEWVTIQNGEDISELVSPRRYLQFIITLDGSVTDAKLVKLNFTYNVKAHTNSTLSDGYYDNFDRIKTIRIDRRATPFQKDGFALADGNISVMNNDSYFSFENEESPYYNYLDSDIRIAISTGIETEFFRKFYGIVDSINIQASTESVDLRFKDLGKLFNKKTIVDGDLSYRTWRNVSLKFLCQILSIDCKFNLFDLNIFNTIASDYVFTYINLKDKNVWTVLQELAQATLSNIYIDDYGKLTLRDMFFAKNKLSIPDASFEGADFMQINYDPMFNSFLYLAQYKQNNSLLYYYYSEYTLLIQNIKAATLMYFDQNDSEESIHTFWAASEHDLYRILSSQDDPSFEKKATIADYVFTNILFTSSIALTATDTNGSAYAERLFMLLRKETTDDHVLFSTLHTFTQTDTFFLGNLGKTTVVEDAIPYYSYNLPLSAKNKENVTVFVDKTDGTSSSIPYDASVPYSESPSSWRFTDPTVRDAIIINKEVPNAIYRIIYAPAVPFDPVSTAALTVDDRFYLEQYEYLDDNKDYLCDFMGVVDYEDDLTHHGHLFYITVAGATLELRTTSGFVHVLPSDLEKIIGCIYDVGKKVFILVYRDDADAYRIYWVSIDDELDTIGTAETILLDGLIDPNLIIYKVKYNYVEGQTYISGGYKIDADNIEAKLFTYTIEIVRCEFDNLAGKPLFNVYPKTPNDITSVINSEYYFHFQKRGGFRAQTSQIWSWSTYLKNNEDKDKCTIRQNIVSSTTSPDGVVKEFYVPGTMNTLDIQYVYVNGSDIGSINWVRGQASITLLYIPQAGDTVEFGDGKKLYKHYGIFTTFDSTEVVVPPGDSSSWDKPTWAIFQPYKAVNLQITFLNCDLNSSVITLSGYDAKGASIIETITFDATGANYTSVIVGSTVNGVVQINTDGLSYIETQVFYTRVDDTNSDFSDVWDDSTSRLQIESKLMDLIKGVYVEIYTSTDENDEQFGGDGTISGYTDKVFIKTIIEDGLKELNNFTRDKAIMCMDITNTGVVMATTYPTGSLIFYNHQLHKLPIIPDYSLDYDNNIQNLSINLSDSTVKNKIVVKAIRKETEPYRDFDKDTGDYIGGGSLPSGYSQDRWDWAKLNTAWRTESPYFLNGGNFSEFNISFQEPLYNGGQETNIRFNARAATTLGRLDANGYWQDDDPESSFPGLKEDNTKMILMAGYGAGTWAHTANYDSTGDPIYRLFAPWESTTHILPAIFPTKMGGLSDFASIPDLSGGIQVAEAAPNIKLHIDGMTGRTVDMTSRAAATPAAGTVLVLPQELANAINAAFTDYGVFAAVKIEYTGGSASIYIEVRSLISTGVSQIYFSTPTGGTATTIQIFGASYPTSGSPRDDVSSDKGEMEVWNCEIYVDGEQYKLDYSAGEYTILIEGTDRYVLTLAASVRTRFAGKLFTIQYPRRLDVTRKDLDQSYEKTATVEGQGSIRRFYYDEGTTLPRLLSSYDYIGTKYQLDSPVGGLHLNMIWDNAAVLENTSYLRVENPTNNQLSANYNPSADSSRLDVWLDKIELRGLRIFDTPLEITTIEDKASQDRYLKHAFTVNNAFIQDAEIGYTIGSYLLKKYKDPLRNANTSILAIPVLELLDVVIVKEQKTGIHNRLFEIIQIGETMQSGSPYVMTILLQKLPKEYQPVYSTKFLSYSNLKFGQEVI